MAIEPNRRILTETNNQGLYEAIWNLTSELTLDVVLQKVTDLSRELVGASYCALGVLGVNARLVRFITSGISERERERIGKDPEGKGILGMMIRRQKPLRLADLAADPESAGVPPHHPRMTSFLGVPIVYKGQILGNIYLTNKIETKEFSQDDENLLTLFAAQAAVAMENARLFENESRRSAQLDVLNRAGRELSRILDLDELFQMVVELLREGFNYRNVKIFWVDLADSTLQVRAGAGPEQGNVSPGTGQPIDQKLEGWVARNGQTALWDDVSQMLRSSSSKDLKTCGALAVPVKV